MPHSRHPTASIVSALGIASAIASMTEAARAASWPDDRDQAHPCRPTVSCTADFASPGALEVELGGAVSTAAQGRAASFPLLLKQSLSGLVQLQVGSNGYAVVAAPSTTPLRYVDNVVFGPKLHLRDQSDAMPSLAVSAAASVPAFRAEGALRDDDAFFTAYASKDVGWLHVDWNVGVDLWRVQQAPATQVFTALALSVSPVPPFGFALEGYYFSDAAPLAAHDGGVRGAVSVTARSWLVADLAGDVGSYPSTRAYSVFFGMTFIPAVFFRPPRGSTSS